MTDDRDWYLPMAAIGADAPDPHRRIYGFPHAGAGCAQLSPLAKALAGQGIAVWSANLPGRQGRLAEPPRSEAGALADELADALAEQIGTASVPYDLFGYCGGAVLAFEVARRLHTRELPLPERILVVSFEAPDIALRPRRLPHLPSDALWAYLGDGGAPSSAIEDPALRRLVEPAVRADFAWLGGYHCEPGPPLPVPVVVYHGAHDPEAVRGAMLGWRRHTTGRVRLEALDGGHWLLDDACAALADAVARDVPAPAHG